MADENLAEVAHRLEAALRQLKPSRSPKRAAASAAAPPSLLPVRAAPVRQPKRLQADARPSRTTTLYDNLERDVASLLGYPTKD
jgi:hypothetical protein